MTTELHSKSYYSFLEAVSSPEQLAYSAKAAGLSTIALVDRNGFYGVPEFYRACSELGVKPIVGVELTFHDYTAIFLAKNREGYRRLSHLVTRAFKGRDKGDPLAQIEYLKELPGHTICVLSGPQDLDQYQQLFGDDLYLGLTLHCEEADRERAAKQVALSETSKVPLVVMGHALYSTREQGPLHDVLLCIKERKTLSESHHVRSGNHHRYLLSPQERVELYADYPEALANAEKVAEECSIEIEFSQYRFPDFPVPKGETAQSYLEKICYERRERCPQLEKELELIDRLDLAGYFLVVWDLVEFAKGRGIPVQGRGSAANSLVAYTLGITPVDPVEHNLYLGRFIHDGMKTIPDIDLDFASTRHPERADREDVIQYVYERYGEEHVAMVATFITFKTKMAIREVGRVLELPEEAIGRLSKLSRIGRDELFTNKELQGEIPDHTWSHFWQLVEEIQEVPRHPSIHVGGMLITSCPVSDLVPLEPARMDGRVVCQWDKDRVDDAGLIKVDILGLGMLAALREAVELMDEPIDLDTLPLDDPNVYEMLARADSVGLFQVESRAQMQSLPRTKPKNFQELGVQVAIIRPGPIQGGMIQPYIARKQGKQPVHCMHPSLKPVLEETLGVILFQEQVLQVATILAGFSQSEAEGLRRAMSRKRSKEAMEALWERFVSGAKEKRISVQIAEQIFRTLEGFATYGFCKSHALSFAKITYQSAWLKLYYPAHFTAALLNNQPMGFYPKKTLLDEAKRAGIEVRGVDVNASRARCHVEEGAIRFGFQMIDGVSFDEARRLEEGQPYRSLRDLVASTRIAERLVESGACDSLGLSRRELLWQLWLLQSDRRQETPLFERSLAVPDLPGASEWESLLGEYRSMGLSAHTHPVAILRRHWNGVLPSNALQARSDGDSVVVGGLVVCRQKPPTAKGFCFLTLEDEFGLMNIIVRPDSYERLRYTIRENLFLKIGGKLQVTDGIYNVLV